MDWQWTLIVQECTGCGICADVCPHAAIAMPPALAYPQPVAGRCVGCMLCVDECPFDAVEVKDEAGPSESWNRRGAETPRQK
jgi:caffeyl-CoA reductase-Etf complex subunit CarE